MLLGGVTGAVVDGAGAGIGEVAVGSVDEAEVEAVAAGGVVLVAASLLAAALADKAGSGLCAGPLEPPPQETSTIVARLAHERARKEH
jgi:hypothetical protein